MSNLISYHKAYFKNQKINKTTLERVEERLSSRRASFANTEIYTHRKENFNFVLENENMKYDWCYKNDRVEIFYLMKLRRYIKQRLEKGELL